MDPCSVATNQLAVLPRYNCREIRAHQLHGRAYRQFQAFHEICYFVRWRQHTLIHGIWYISTRSNGTSRAVSRSVGRSKRLVRSFWNTCGVSAMLTNCKCHFVKDCKYFKMAKYTACKWACWELWSKTERNSSKNLLLTVGKKLMRNM